MIGKALASPMQCSPFEVYPHHTIDVMVQSHHSCQYGESLMRTEPRHFIIQEVLPWPSCYYSISFSKCGSWH